MKIILMRHGKPMVDLNAIRKVRVSSKEMGKIIRDYKVVDLDRAQQIPEASQDIANQCDVVFASNLKRAQSSVEMLNLQKQVIFDNCFRESDHPYFNSEWPRLRFFTWAICYRLAWMIGFKKNGESIRIGQQRAETAADKLIIQAKPDQPVLLVGHGIMNRLIAKQLKQNTWRKTHNSGHGYWSYMVFEKT